MSVVREPWYTLPMTQKKDSKLRTVDREYGKLVIVWDGIKYGQAGPSNLSFKDDVIVTVPEPDKPVTIRVVCPATGLVDEPGVWKMIGFVGGKKGEETWRKEHARRKKVQEQLAAVAATILPEIPAETEPSEIVGIRGVVPPEVGPVGFMLDGVHVKPRFKFGKDDETQPAPENHPKRRVIPSKTTKEERVGENMSTVREVAKKYSFKLISQRIVLMFPSRDKAAGFKVAAVKRGWKVFDIGEPTPGNHEIHIQLK